MRYVSDFSLRLILSILVRIVTVYVFSLIFIRLMGKRELDRLTVFDFIIAVALGEIIGAPMVDVRIPVWHALVAICIVAALELVVSLLSLKLPGFRRVIHGAPTVLIENGTILHENLRSLRYNLSDLLAQLRQNGVASMDEVAYAVLENSGRLSVLLKDEERPLRPKDLRLRPPKKGVAINLVIDGQIQYDNLEKLGFDENWLRDKLGLDPKNVDNILLATVDQSGHVYIDLKWPGKKETISGDLLN